MVTLASDNEWDILVGETRNCAVSFKGMLDSGELLSGTPTVAEITSSDLTLGSKALNTATLTIDDDTSVLASQAVQFTVTGGTADTKYQVLITVGTDDSQTLQWIQTMVFHGVT